MVDVQVSILAFNVWSFFNAVHLFFFSLTCKVLSICISYDIGLLCHRTEEQSSNKKTKKRNSITSIDSSDSGKPSPKEKLQWSVLHTLMHIDLFFLYFTALADLIPPLESDLEESGSFLTQQQVGSMFD